VSSHVELAKSFLSILSGGNLSPLRELFCDDIRFEYPGISAITGRGKTVVLLKRIMSQFTSLQFEAIDFVEQDDKLCVVWKNDGWLKTGEPFHNEGVTVLHIRNGTISFVSDYFKQDRTDRQP
jgi:ketosteroid isomerase-like protein